MPPNRLDTQTFNEKIEMPTWEFLDPSEVNSEEEAVRNLRDLFQMGLIDYPVLSLNGEKTQLEQLDSKGEISRAQKERLNEIRYDEQKRHF